MGKKLRLLAFSDLHCNSAAAKEIVRQSADVDWVIGAGDFATVRRGIEITIDILKAITRPTVIVPGNGESFEELQTACRDWPSVHVLHGSGVEIDGVQVFGIGGAIPVTPFGAWSYDFSEDHAAKLLATCPARCVLVSHSPPQGACDRNSTGRHLGSTTVRGLVERLKPLLVVCGHIHDSWQQREMIGPTEVINAGPQMVFVDLVVD
jgi:Icc-related predicted phosphoesterase